MVDDFPVGLQGTSWHAASAGALCVAGQSQLQAVFDPERLTSPLRRSDAGEPGESVSWNDAHEILQGQIQGLLARGEGQRILVVDGRTPSLGTRLAESWVQSLPGARYVPLRIEPVLDRHLGGFLGEARNVRTQLDLAHSGTLLLVGFELLEFDGSPVTQMRMHGERREDPHLSDAPTIYIGPRQGPTAVKADLWIPCQPGQERDILIGLAEMLSRQHPDKERVMKEYARWIPEARDPVSFARDYSLERIAQRHGLDLEQLLTLMRALVNFSPSVALAGPGLLRREAGGAVVQATLALNLWTGGFQEQSGLSWARDPLAEMTDQMDMPITRSYDPRALADMLEPLLETQRSYIEVLICIEANLAHELPGYDQVNRALSHVPFIASYSTLEDETSQHAHLTLPTLLDLESWDIPAPAWGVPESVIQVQRPALIPVVDGRSVTDSVLALAASGLCGEDFRPPAASSAKLVEIGVRAIVESRRGRLLDATGERPLRGVERTLATKALLAGEAVWLDDPTTEPVARSAAEPKAMTPAAAVDLAPDQLWLVPFDVQAIQGGRILNRPMMMELSGLWHGIAWETWIEIHHQDALTIGVVSGNYVMIRGPRAKIQARVVVTSAIARHCVAVPLGMGHRALGNVARGHGANPLDLLHAVVDKETGVPALGPIPVFLEKL